MKVMQRDGCGDDRASFRCTCMNKDSSYTWTIDMGTNSVAWRRDLLCSCICGGFLPAPLLAALVSSYLVLSCRD